MITKSSAYRTNNPKPLRWTSTSKACRKMLASKGEITPPCGVPLPDQFQHPPIRDPQRHLRHEQVMVDVVEEAPDVGLGHLGEPVDERLPDEFLGLHRRPLRPEPIRD